MLICSSRRDLAMIDHTEGELKALTDTIDALPA